MFRRFQALKKGVETIKKVAPKVGTTKSNLIKKSNRQLKDLEKTMEKGMTPKLKSEGEKLKKEIKETRKQIYKSKMADGGSISPKDIEKMKEKAKPAADRAFDILRKFKQKPATKQIKGDSGKQKKKPPFDGKDKPKSIREKIAPKKKMDRLKELKKELG